MKQPIAHETIVSGGVIVREYHLPAGSDLVTHDHPYDHLSILLSGKALLTVGDMTVSLVGPKMVEIKAGIAHGIHAVTDCHWDCLHSLFLAERESARGDPYVLHGVMGGNA